MNDSENLKNIDELIDLRNVKINKKQSLNRRTQDFIAQVGNPYLFRVGDIAVKLEFGGEKTFSQMLAEIISAG